MKIKADQKIGMMSLGLLAFVFAASYWIIPIITKDVYEPSAVAGVLGTTTPPALPEILHIKTPAEVKGIYMTSCVVGTPSFRDSLVKVADTTEVNAIIIDVKDFSGTLSFTPENPELLPYVSNRCRASDMKAFIKTLHEKGIYVIARITVFQDPFFTARHPEFAVRRASDGGVWKDKKGISYIDPGAEGSWDYIISLAKESYDIGFDEINFDYIRFPSDGNMKDISFPFSKNRPKPEVLESFFSYLHARMSAYGIPTSADLFGMTTTNFDDLGIGQVLERTLPYFDYVMPMVYPSHYPPNFNGWKNPNHYPYELIYYVMKRGADRAVATSSPIKTLTSERIGTSTPARFTKPEWDKNKLRTWIQDFNYGGTYGPKEVRAQIDASYAAGLHSWIIWSPSNRYTIGALKAE